MITATLNPKWDHSLLLAKSIARPVTIATAPHMVWQTAFL